MRRTILVAITLNFMFLCTAQDSINLVVDSYFSEERQSRINACNSDYKFDYLGYIPQVSFAYDYQANRVLPSLSYNPFRLFEIKERKQEKKNEIKNIERDLKNEKRKMIAQLSSLHRKIAFQKTVVFYNELALEDIETHFELMQIAFKENKINVQSYNAEKEKVRKGELNLLKSKEKLFELEDQLTLLVDEITD